MKKNSESSKKREPQTMEELLSQTGYVPRGLKRGEKVEGKVTQITSKAIFLDIGAKSEGIIVDKEYELAKDFIKTLKAGNKVEARVLSPEDKSGQILLSLRGLAQKAAWENLLKKKKTGEEIEVRGKEVSRGGLVVETSGILGFIPTSHLRSSWQTKLGTLVGQKMKVKIIEADETQNRLICSEKAVSEAEKLAKTAKILKKVKIGEVFSGEVVGIAPFGIFVQIKRDEFELEGLVHISEASWEKVEDPNKLFSVGDKVKVMVIGIDEESFRLALSIKKLVPDPWQEKVKKYKVDSQVSGKVIRLAPYGAFVELEEGVEGLLHISKIPAEKKINVGDKVSCFVEAVEPEKRRLSLGLVLKKKPVGYK